MTIYGEKGYLNYLRDIDEARRNWGWFLALGVLLIVLGIGVISFSTAATIFSVIIFGVFLLAAGVVEIIQTFLARKWSAFFLSLLLGILYLATGFLCVSKPAVSAITLTFWIAIFLFIAGLFRMISSLLLRFDQWGWVFFNGLVTFILGILIYSEWPVSGLWIIGLFIGIDMILAGWSWVILSLTARSYIR